MSDVIKTIKTLPFRVKPMFDICVKLLKKE